MRKQVIADHFALRAQMGDGIGDVCRVPIDDRSDREIEAGSPELLGFMSSVGDPSLLERADGTSQLVTLFALVEASMAASTECWAFKPVEHE